MDHKLPEAYPIRGGRRKTVKTIHYVLDIDAQIDSVWPALTEPEQLASWWSTKLEMTGGGVGDQIKWIFAGDFNPVMEITDVEASVALGWRCISGHEPWQDSTFRFGLSRLGDGRTHLRFWQGYAVELADDYYGVYTSTGVTTSKACAYCVLPARGSHSRRPTTKRLDADVRPCGWRDHRGVPSAIEARGGPRLKPRSGMRRLRFQDLQWQVVKPSCSASHGPVTLSVAIATSSGVPVATIRPPLGFAPGPMSMM